MWEDGVGESSDPIVNLHHERLIKLYLHRSIALRPRTAAPTTRRPQLPAKEATPGSISPSGGLEQHPSEGHPEGQYEEQSIERAPDQARAVHIA